MFTTNCQLSGSVGGDVDLEVGSDEPGPPPSAFGPPPPVAFPMVPAGLTITDTASIDGSLTYRSPSEGVNLLIVLFGFGGLVLWMFHLRKRDEAKTGT